jgi:NADH:ubiquinone reductase (H+-translocating)
MVGEQTRVTEKNTSSRKRVVVIGGGFAGLHVAKGLAAEPVDIILVDRRNHHTFQPLLYQVALAVLSPADIAQPIRAILGKQKNVSVVMDEAVSIADGTVELKSGVTLAYDYLCLATGSTHSYFGHDDWASLAPGLKSVEDATEIRRRILLAFELAERQAIETGSHPPLNFVVVGGGATGVELAGAISDITKSILRRDYRHVDADQVRISLYEGLPRVLNGYTEDLTKSAEAQLRALGVDVHTNSRVEDVKPGYLIVNNERIDAVVTLWGAGVQASPVGRMLGTPLDRKGCVIVDEFLNPPGRRNVFVLGDLAHVEENGKQVPGVAQPAMQMGDQAARNIARDLARKPREKFHYFDKGDMATIGRYAAVADIKWPFRAHWSGFMAWITWAFVHIYFLIGFRNRLAVLAQWAWTIFIGGRSARLITGSQSLVGWEEGVHEEKAAVTTSSR